MIKWFIYYYSRGISLILLSFIVSFFACRSVSEITAEAEEIIFKEDLLNRLQGHNCDIYTYSSRSLQITFDDNDSYRGTVRMYRDSSIIITMFGFPGIEAGRILFGPDSIKVVDRLNREYSLLSSNRPNMFIPVGLELPFAEKIFIPHTSSIIESADKQFDFRENYPVSEGSIILQNIKHNHCHINCLNFIKIDPLNDFLPSELNISYLNRSSNISIIYNSYIRSGKYKLPDDIDIIINSGRTNFKMNIKLSRIEVNQSVNMSFNIPDNYKRVEF